MRKFVLAAVLVLMASGAQAATLIIDGQLLGASDVLVEGLYYNVEFVDGTCIDLFSGCDDASDFTFNTSTSAQAAAQALMDQVYCGGGCGSDAADQFSEYTNGVSSQEYGVMKTVWGIFDPSGGPPSKTRLWGFVNTRIWHEVPDYIAQGEDLFPADTSSSAEAAHDVYARWSLVPEPSTGLLVGFGLVGLAGKGRRRNRS